MRKRWRPEAKKNPGKVYPRKRTAPRSPQSIRRIIRHAQRQLMLTHWTVDFHVIKQSHWKLPGNAAYIEITKSYRLALITICEDQLRHRDADFLWLMRHELCHIIQDQPEEQCVESINTIVREHEAEIKALKAKLRKARNP